MPIDTSTDWTISFNGQALAYSDTADIEDCIQWTSAAADEMTTTTACGFVPEITVEFKNAPDISKWLKTLFIRTPASMLQNHIWSKHCQKLRRALRARWFK